MSNYRRRRFLTDLLFVGGALLAAAGLASTGEANPGETPTPLQTPEVTPSPAPTCGTKPELPMPGEMVAPPPSPSPTPRRTPAKDPFNRPADEERPMPGQRAVVKPPTKNYNTAGGLAPHPRGGK